MTTKFSLLLFLSSLTFYKSFGQCRIEDYLLSVFNKDKFMIEKTYSDTTITSYFNHSDIPQKTFDNQKDDKIDAFNFKLKNLICVENYKDNYCSIYFRKNKLYAVEINIFFDKKDSTLCKTTFYTVIKDSKIESEFPIVYSGTTKHLLEYSNLKSIDLQTSLTTPYFEFYKNITKKESIRVGYTFSNMSNEYELSIMYLNQVNKK